VRASNCIHLSAVKRIEANDMVKKKRARLLYMFLVL